MCVCCQHWVFLLVLTICGFSSVPEYRVWRLVLVVTFSLEDHLGCLTLLRRAVELGWFPSALPVVQKTSCSLVCPSCSSLLLVSCCKAFSAASISFHVSICKATAVLSTFRLRPSAGNPGEETQAASPKYILLNVKFCVCVFLTILHSKTPLLLCTKVGAAVKLAADVFVRLQGSSPPQHGLWQKQWCDKAASAGSAPGHLTASKLPHQAGAPSAGWLGEESAGSPTVFSATGEAISQDEWLVRAGEMILFALTLCHFAVYRYHREEWHYLAFLTAF